MPHGGFGFTAPVAADGYAWWYVDALSDDGQNGLTIIGFIGSVFSPYYALARRHGPADPYDHCAMNVALYGPHGKRWAMTERGRTRLSRDETSLSIGPSSFRWDGAALTISVDEWTVPRPRRIEGTIRLHPTAVSEQTFHLDGDGRHRWRPIAPTAAVEVSLTRPALRWSGSGYFDMNAGDTPLETAFRSWTWSRTIDHSGATILYDVDRRDGGSLALCLGFDRDGGVRTLAAPPPAPLPRTLWRVERSTRADPGHKPTLLRTFEDAPFYTRSLIASQLFGRSITAVHESLSMDRFRSPVVQVMLPFRMPRRAR